MAETIRTFIAIELNDALHRALGETQENLKQARAAKVVRWVAPENIHLTLKFLGDVDAEKIPDVNRAIEQACVGVAPFVINIRGLGAFPNLQRPNVVWIGMSGQTDAAELLAKKIEDACAALGFPREQRPFAAHLTLGRVKKDARPNDRRAIGELIANAQLNASTDFRVERVSMMKSELKSSGSVYSRLAAIELYG